MTLLPELATLNQGTLSSGIHLASFSDSNPSRQDCDVLAKKLGAGSPISEPRGAISELRPKILPGIDKKTEKAAVRGHPPQSPAARKLAS